MQDDDLTIMFFILGDGYDQIEEVTISRNKSVPALKHAVKATYENRLKNVDAAYLVLYKASIPISPRLPELATELAANEPRLDPSGILSEVFADELPRAHVHLVVEIPSRAWVYVVLSSLC
jgi:hypothetical protein